MSAVIWALISGLAVAALGDELDDSWAWRAAILALTAARAAVYLSIWALGQCLDLVDEGIGVGIGDRLGSFGVDPDPVTVSAPVVGSTVAGHLVGDRRRVRDAEALGRRDLDAVLASSWTGSGRVNDDEVDAPGLGRRG